MRYAIYTKCIISCIYSFAESHIERTNLYDTYIFFYLFYMFISRILLLKKCIFVFIIIIYHTNLFIYLMFPGTNGLGRGVTHKRVHHFGPNLLPNEHKLTMPKQLEENEPKKSQAIFYYMSKGINYSINIIPQNNCHYTLV